MTTSQGFNDNDPIRGQSLTDGIGSISAVEKVDQQSFHSKPFDLEEGDVYDRIVVEGDYFDYPAAARDISSILTERARILELCAGTGNLAVELARLGHPVTGLDASEAMLEKSRSRVAGLPVGLVEGDATSFSLSEAYDAVVIHSGNLIINRVETGTLRLNGESEAAMRGTLESASKSLKVGGKLVFNIEHWYDKAVPYPDGSVYIRIIEEETDEHGSRVHVFYDARRNHVTSEVVIRKPKIPFEVFLGELAAQNFGQFTEHVPVEAYGDVEPGLPSLYSATKIA